MQDELVSGYTYHSKQCLTFKHLRLEDGKSKGKIRPFLGKKNHLHESYNRQRKTRIDTLKSQHEKFTHVYCMYEEIKRQSRQMVCVFLSQISSNVPLISLSFGPKKEAYINCIQTATKYKMRSTQKC